MGKVDTSKQKEDFELGDSSKDNTATHSYESFETNQVFCKANYSTRQKLSEIQQDLKLYEQFVLNTRVKEALQAMQIFDDKEYADFVASLQKVEESNKTIVKFHQSCCEKIEKKVGADQKNGVHKKKLERNLDRLKCVFEYHKAITQYDLDLQNSQIVKNNEEKQNNITHAKSKETYSSLINVL